jgi:hypothetical protein
MGGGGERSRDKKKCRETTPPGVESKGHRMFESNGLKIRFDMAKNGIEEHWHIMNPNIQDTNNPYLDYNGKPTVKTDPKAHMTNDQYANAMNKLGRNEC